MTSLADARGTLTIEPAHPTERDVSEEEPRVGVFVCHCGTNIAGVVDVENVADYAHGLANVVYSDRLDLLVLERQLAQIREKIAEHDLNRVVVASCTPRTHEPHLPGHAARGRPQSVPL